MNGAVGGTYRAQIAIGTLLSEDLGQHSGMVAGEGSEVQVTSLRLYNRGVRYVLMMAQIPALPAGLVFVRAKVRETSYNAPTARRKARPNFFLRLKCKSLMNVMGNKASEKSMKALAAIIY